MSRLVEGIKDLLKGKDDDEPEYRYRSGYDRRQSPGSSTKYYGYPSSATSEVRNGFQRPYGQALEGYQNGYDRRGGNGSEISPRGDYRRTSLESPREYNRKSYRGSNRESDDNEIVLMVPMCCDKCKEKVQEELSEVEGVESVHCDQYNSRVTVTGDNIDTDRCLVKAERAVKKKCELITDDDDEDADNRGSGRRGGSGRMERSRDDLYRGSGRDERMSSGYYGGDGRSGRPSLGRLPSFASGKMTQYDRGQDYEAKDYSGYRSMPSFNKHRHHEAEYITSFNQRPESRDSRRDYYNVRRMPSFNRHRHHDAEYINTGDLEYSPRTFYENTGSTYTAAYNERPVYRSQVSFSRLPVGNPNYVKHIQEY